MLLLGHGQQSDIRGSSAEVIGQQGSALRQHGLRRLASSFSSDCLIAYKPLASSTGCTIHPPLIDDVKATQGG